MQIQGELDLVQVNEEFELSEFELAGDYCSLMCKPSGVGRSIIGGGGGGQYSYIRVHRP